MRRNGTWLVVCLLAAVLSQPVRGLADGSYAVMISASTSKKVEWKLVADALQAKHGAHVITYTQGMNETLDSLRAVFPKYVCFVTTLEETTRQFVAEAHKLTRRLDDDPYTDAIWGIITGYTADDALRIAKHRTPLAVRRILTGTVGSPLDAYDAGLMYNELKAQVMWEKESGGPVEQKACAIDTTKALVDAMNNYKPDVFITSGHATERDWQIGFGYRNGYFRCADGQLYGLDTQKVRYVINSPNPKVHLAVGNCLIAHIPDPNCMALALMHSAGIYQMVGYTVPTGYGYGGWGVKDYFSELQAGRFTLAEAHYVNGLALVYELETRSMNFGPGQRVRGGIRGDRDTVVLYGDPAWEARMPRRPLPWSQMLAIDDGTYTLTITANERGDWDNRPIVELLPHRVAQVQVIEGQEYEPVITDNFILVQMRDELLPMKGNRGESIPVRGDYGPGQIIKIVFRAKRIDAG